MHMKTYRYVYIYLHMHEHACKYKSHIYICIFFFVFVVRPTRALVRAYHFAFANKMHHKHPTNSNIGSFGKHA